MAKSQNKSGRETRKAKNDDTAGKKLPRYLRDSAPTQIDIQAPKPTKKAPPAN